MSKRAKKINLRKQKNMKKFSRGVPPIKQKTKKIELNKKVDKEFIDQLSTDKEAKLYKAKGTPKLIIPNKVWSQIQSLLLEYHSTEWSGIFYYTDNGSRKVDELVVTAEYLLPMTIGQTAYTSFDWQKKEALIFNATLIKDQKEWRKGCLHSHNNMSVFFSGEDNKDLKEQALYHYYYVSVIVNNDQKVMARLSHKLSQSEAESVFGNVMLDQNVVYYDMKIEVEKSVDYTEHFDKALSTMNDMRRSYRPNHNIEFPNTGKPIQGKQGSFWNKDNWNPNLTNKTSNLNNNPTNRYSAPLIDDTDILNLFNENELIPGDNSIASIDELENKLTLYYHDPGFDQIEFLQELTELWMNEFIEIEVEEVFEVFEPEHHNLNYLFKLLYGV